MMFKLCIKRQEKKMKCIKIVIKVRKRLTCHLIKKLRIQFTYKISILNKNSRFNIICTFIWKVRRPNINYVFCSYYFCMIMNIEIWQKITRKIFRIQFCNVYLNITSCGFPHTSPSFIVEVFLHSWGHIRYKLYFRIRVSQCFEQFVLPLISRNIICNYPDYTCVWKVL